MIVMMVSLIQKGFMIILNVIAMTSYVVLFLFPLNNLSYLLVLSFFAGLCNCVGTVCYGMISDCIEYGDWKCGVREEGLATSYLSLSVKLATAICGSVGILLVAAVGYVPNAEQSEATKQGINFIVNIIPAICMFVSIVPMFFYKLNAKKVAEIRNALDDRNAKRVKVD